MFPSMAKCFYSKVIKNKLKSLYRVRSPLLTVSRLIFYLVIKMIQFTKFIKFQLYKTGFPYGDLKV